MRYWKSSAQWVAAAPLPATFRLNAWLKGHNQAFYCRRMPYPPTITPSRSTFRCPHGNLRPRRPRSPDCSYHPVGLHGLVLLASVDHERPASLEEIPGRDILKTRTAPATILRLVHPHIHVFCHHANIGIVVYPHVCSRVDGNMRTGRMVTTTCCAAGSTAEGHIRMNTPRPQLTARHDD